MSKEIIIYTDGSSIGNGKPTCVGGWSCVFFIQDKIFARYGHLSAPSSNNRAEIMGVLFAISMLKDKKDYHLSFKSDSQYVVNSISKWRHGWKKSNFDGIKNPDLIVPLSEMWDYHGNSNISWVKGHIGIRGNELADEFAGLGSKQICSEKNNGVIDIKMIDKDWKPKWPN